ncbi:ABC transporter permease [Novosphingobium bradum]|uniref:ABC transporter permease n=1 Tax=Novosphingobium bradum TaxID=1737444 RepID=A0ABV7IRE7_9SPHN
MASLREGTRIQFRVITALMIRELTTRFGRENIGFLWIMAEPLLFGSLVSIMWTIMKGPEEHGVSVVAFVITGYLPLTLFRNSVNRAVSVFQVNSSLMYHRQIKILDFIFVRVLVEVVGTLMAYLFVAVVLIYFDLFPVPADLGIFVAGFLLYSLFTLSLCLVIAPASEMSSALEKFMPVTTYIMIPVSGTFNMVSWLTPAAREYLLWSPPVNAMEMMRAGIFGDQVAPYYGFAVPLLVPMVLSLLGLFLCRIVRNHLEVE